MNKHQRRIQHATMPLLRRRRRQLFTVFILMAFALMAYYVVTPPPSQAQLTPSANIVISQVYVGGGNAGATYTHDFVELYNRGNTSVDIAGWSIQITTASGTTWTVLNISTALQSGRSTVIAPGKYFLIRMNSSGTPSGSVALPDFDASNTGVNLANTGGGKVALVIDTTALTGSCPQTDTQTTRIRDFVGYGSADCSETAAAPLPANNASIIRKSNTGGTAGTTGCQDTNSNLADFQTITPPTPRSSNSAAASCGVGAFTITFDNSAKGCNFTSAIPNPTPALPTSFTWKHKIGSGTSRVLIVGVSTSYELLALGLPSQRVASVTYNGQAMTRLGTQVSDAPDNRVAVEMFRLKETETSPAATLPPAAGQPVDGYDVVVNLITPGLGGLTPDYAVGGSASFNGVDQTNPNRAFVGDADNTTAPTLIVTSDADEVVIDTVGTTFNGQTLLVGAGQTQRWNGVDGANSCFGGVASVGAGSTQPGAADTSTTTTMSWTMNGGAQPWAIGAVSLNPLASTKVELASFDAAQTNAGVLLNWNTGYEVDNLGFNLYREQHGKRTRVNPSIIAGSALLAGQGTKLTAGKSYSWLDRSSKGKESVQYWVEDIDLKGTRTLHGPIVPASGESMEISGTEQAMLLSQLNLSSSDTASVTGYPAAQIQKTERQMPEAQQAQAQPSQLNAKKRLAGKLLLLNDELMDSVVAKTARVNRQPTNIFYEDQLGKQRTLAAGAAVKIAIRQAGWYRVTRSELVAAGVNPNIDPSLLQLYAEGVEQSILQNGNKKQLDANSSIEFYATGMDTPTSDTRTYWLVVGSKSGKRINSQNAGSALGVEKDGSGWIETPKTESAPKPQQTTKPTTSVNPVAINPASAVTNAIVPGAVLILPRDTSPAVSAPKAKKKASRKKTGRKLLRDRHHALGSPQEVQANSSSQGFAYTVERKDRSVYFSALLNGEADNFFGPVITGTPVKQTMSLNAIDNSTSRPASLEVALQGGTIQAHQVRVEFNGTEVGVMSFADQQRPSQRFQIPRAWLTEGDNTVTLTSLGGDGDVNVLDYLRLTYWHDYRAVNNKLTFTSDHTTPITIYGFTSPQIKVFDITDQDEVEQLNIKVSPKGSGYAVKIPGGRGTTRTLIALAEVQTQSPAGISANEPSNWTRSENRADLVILTHGDFREAVKPLADLRRGQGLEVAVVNIEDVYDEFSYSEHSTHAVSKFFLWTKTNWERAPSYALFVGDASADPRNYLNRGYQDYVPTKLIDTRLFETSSDDALVDFNDDGIADIAVGRLPVQTIGQAQTVIGKIINYVPGQSSYGALLVSDHLDSYDFEAANNRIRELLPADVPVTSVNRRDRAPEQVRSDIISGINQGPQLVNYAGHGSVAVWTGAGILRSEDKTSFTNGNKLPFFVTMTCLNGFFQDVFTESLAEAMIRADNGGAVAVWASSGLTEPDRQALMDQQLIRLVFNEGQSPTLGDAVRGAKAATTDMDVRRTWIFFGDPTMRIR